MNVAKELTGVSKIAITLMVLTYVAATEATFLMEMACRAVVCFLIAYK